MVQRQRKPNRLSGYDYSKNGKYFITICTHKRELLLGGIVENIMILNEYGKIVQSEIERIPTHYENISIDIFVVMPNHVHCIVSLVGDALARPITPTITETSGAAITETSDVAGILGAASGAPTIGNVIRGFKSGVSRKCGFSIWQRNYHDHIIRNEKAYTNIYEYIINNPAKWKDDCFYEIFD